MPSATAESPEANGAPMGRASALMELGEVVDLARTNIDPRHFPDEVFEYYSIPAYQEGRRPIPEMGRSIGSPKLLVSPGIVLFGKLNPRVPKVWTVGADSERRQVASSEFIPLRAIPGVLAGGYLYYLCWSDAVLPRAQELVSGSTPSRQRVDVSAFMRLVVPVPDLPQQLEIASRLSTIEQARAASERRSAALGTLLTSAVHHLIIEGEPEVAPS
jgi:type I restriction enzyme S subunit